MRASQVLQDLKSIVWRYATHHSKDGFRPKAEALVQFHYDKKKLEDRGVEHAVIKSSFHLGDDSKEHLTVEFKDAKGSHVTTHHVYDKSEYK